MGGMGIMKRWVIGLAALMVVAAFGRAEAAISLTDFEPAGFATGQSVHNHLVDGNLASPRVEYINWAPPAWAVMYAARTAPVDEEIVDLGGTHGKVWRYSTGLEDGRLGQTPRSPHAGFVAGETGALNDAGMGPVTTNTFYGQVDFRSAVMAPQPDLAVRLCAASADQRHGYVNILDDGAAGFDLHFWRADLDAYDVIDANLSYTDWHTLGIEILFHDGPANDVVNLYVDGSMIHTGPSWEAYYTAHSESVDRLTFDTYLDERYLGAGLYFDNVLVAEQQPPAAVIPEPSTLTIFAVGLACVALCRWRRRTR